MLPALEKENIHALDVVFLIVINMQKEKKKTSSSVSSNTSELVWYVAKSSVNNVGFSITRAL